MVHSMLNHDVPSMLLTSPVEEVMANHDAGQIKSMPKPKSTEPMMIVAR